MSTPFDDRERAFEAKFQHDAELKFKAIAHANKKIGLWAADILGKTGDDADSYAIEVVKSDMEEAGHEDVFRKVSGDLGDKVSEADIREMMGKILIEAGEIFGK
ncbi:MAG: DUF1476 domain-containing protein [Halocynthiibacter sp.]